MLVAINQSFLPNIKNKIFRTYAELYVNNYEDFKQSVTNFGLPFVEDDKSTVSSQEIINELRKKDIIFRSSDSSIVHERISKACEACRKGIDSYTSYISLMCHKNCYFCFNPNQQNYDYYCTHKKDWKRELSELYQRNKQLKYIALTGGEPLIHKEDVVEFFSVAKSYWPSIHTRLYTAGDLLNEDLLLHLKEVGLNEIRFSIKLEESKEKMNQVLEKIRLANSIIDDVLVEMPVMPDAENEMKYLLDKLEEYHIFGINLLELCFPYNNAAEFIKRNYYLKNPPYPTLYNFWYAGGLPINGSEETALKLVQYAVEKKYKLGVHYCSLNNKHFGQVYQQNTLIPQTSNNFLFSEKDFYLKTIKLFGNDGKYARRILKKNNVVDYIYNEKYQALQFHPKHMELLKEYDFEVGVCYSIMEIRNQQPVNRELRIDYTTCRQFDINDL